MYEVTLQSSFHTEILKHLDVIATTFDANLQEHWDKIECFLLLVYFPSVLYTVSVFLKGKISLGYEYKLERETVFESKLCHLLSACKFLSPSVPPFCHL